MKNKEWGKYDIPQELEPTLGEKVREIIGSIIGCAVIFATMYILVCLTAAF